MLLQGLLREIGPALPAHSMDLSCKDRTFHFFPCWWRSVQSVKAGLAQLNRKMETLKKGKGGADRYRNRPDGVVRPRVGAGNPGDGLAAGAIDRERLLHTLDLAHISGVFFVLALSEEHHISVGVRELHAQKDRRETAHDEDYSREGAQK